MWRVGRCGGVEGRLHLALSGLRAAPLPAPPQALSRKWGPRTTTQTQTLAGAGSQGSPYSKGSTRLGFHGCTMVLKASPAWG